MRRGIHSKVTTHLPHATVPVHRTTSPLSAVGSPALGKHVKFIFCLLSWLLEGGREGGMASTLGCMTEIAAYTMLFSTHLWNRFGGDPQLGQLCYNIP